MMTPSLEDITKVLRGSFAPGSFIVSKNERIVNIYDLNLEPLRSYQASFRIHSLFSLDSEHLVLISYPAWYDIPSDRGRLGRIQLLNLTSVSTKDFVISPEANSITEGARLDDRTIIFIVNVSNDQSQYLSLHRFSDDLKSLQPVSRIDIKTRSSTEFWADWREKVVFMISRSSVKIRIADYTIPSVPKLKHHSNPDPMGNPDALLLPNGKLILFWGTSGQVWDRNGPRGEIFKTSGYRHNLQMVAESRDTFLTEDVNKVQVWKYLEGKGKDEVIPLEVYQLPKLDSLNKILSIGDLWVVIGFTLGIKSFLKVNAAKLNLETGETKELLLEEEFDPLLMMRDDEKRRVYRCLLERRLSKYLPHDLVGETWSFFSP
jgi:hypothetical protein